MTSRDIHTGAALELLRVSKTFGPVIAVDGVSLTVAPGEFLTLLGPSGSGKTTTLMMIAGFESATAGEIMLDGRPLTRVPPYRRNLGMVFQHYALFPHMTVYDNVAFPLRTRGATRTETNQRVADALDRVHLPGYGARFPTVHRSCSWTSRSARSTRSCASRCSWRSSTSSGSSSSR